MNQNITLVNYTNFVESNFSEVDLDQAIKMLQGIQPFELLNSNLSFADHPMGQWYYWVTIALMTLLVVYGVQWYVGRRGDMDVEVDPEGPAHHHYEVPRPIPPPPPPYSKHPTSPVSITHNPGYGTATATTPV